MKNLKRNTRFSTEQNYKQNVCLSNKFKHLINTLPLKASACCSADAFTIFQKQSDTAKLRFRVEHWDVLRMPVLRKKI